MDSLVRWELLAVLSEDLSMDPHTIDDDTHLAADLGFDSVLYPMAAVAIEESLGVTLTAERLQDCRTFGDVIDLVESLRRTAGAGY